VPSRSKIAALGNSRSSRVGAGESSVPVSVGRVLCHVPVEIRRAVFPPDRTPLAKRPLDQVHGPVRGCFRFAVGPLLRVAYCRSGRHWPANEINSLGFIEIGVRHAPKSAADDEVATVRRHRIRHNPLGRLPLRFGRWLFRRGLLPRFLAGDRHQHFFLTACDLAVTVR
jgi:hypothetical protein